MLSYSVAIVLGGIAALVCTILSLVLVTPDKKREKLSTFFKIIHDIFNFKFLVIEKILKFLYIFATLFCIGAGFFLLFSGYSGYYSSYSFAGRGLLIMLLGPIAVRIVFELSMMVIILIKNVVEINNKLKNQNQENKAENIFANQPAFTVVTPDAAPTEPTETAAQPENWMYCSQCGTKYDANKGNCPNCAQK